MPAAAVLVALGAFAMLWALIGLQYGYGYTLGAFLQQLARAIGAIRLPSFLSGARLLGFAADAITAIDNAVRRAIGLGIEASGAVFNECLHFLAVAVHFVGNEIASLSHDAAQAIEHLHVQQITNVYKVGKRACGMNPDLLESLLADTLLIAGTVSLVEFARGMQDVTEEVTPLIRTFWRAT